MAAIIQHSLLLLSLWVSFSLAIFNTNFPDLYFECSDFTVNFTQTPESQPPFQLLIMPLSSSSTRVFEIPASAFNPATNVVTFSTIVPYISGTPFIAAVQDSRGRDFADVSRSWTVQGSGDTSCIRGFDPNRREETNNVFPTLLQLTPSPPPQCGFQTISWTLPSPLPPQALANGVSDVAITGYVAEGEAFSLQEAFGQVTSQNAVFQVDLSEGTEYGILLEYAFTNGTIRREFSSLQKVANSDDTSCLPVPPTPSFNPQSVDGASPTGGFGGPGVTLQADNNRSGVVIAGTTFSTPILILIFVAAAFGVAAAVGLFIVFPLVWFFWIRPRKKRAQAMKMNLEAGGNLGGGGGRPPSPPFSLSEKEKEAVELGYGYSEKDRSVLEANTTGGTYTTLPPSLVRTRSQRQETTYDPVSVYSQVTVAPLRGGGGAPPPLPSEDPFASNTSLSSTEQQSTSGRSTLPPLPPNPSSMKRAAQGRRKPIVEGKKGGKMEVESWGNSGPLPLSMTEMDPPPRPDINASAFVGANERKRRETDYAPADDPVKIRYLDLDRATGGPGPYPPLPSKAMSPGITNRL